jgi:hypothetical protein
MFLHISSCGYPSAYPQPGLRVFAGRGGHWLLFQASVQDRSRRFQHQPADEAWFFANCPTVSSFSIFFRTFQNYSKKKEIRFTYKGMYTRIVVVVNGWHFLWTSQESCTLTSACSRYKSARRRVCGWWQIWTIFPAVHKAELMHNRCLWISRTLSTRGYWRNVYDLVSLLN